MRLAYQGPDQLFSSVNFTLKEASGTAGSHPNERKTTSLSNAGRRAVFPPDEISRHRHKAWEVGSSRSSQYLFAVNLVPVELFILKTGFQMRR